MIPLEIHYDIFKTHAYNKEIVLCNIPLPFTNNVLIIKIYYNIIIFSFYN